MSDNRQVIVRCQPLIVRWYPQDPGEQIGNGGSGYCQCQDHIHQMSGRGAIQAGLVEMTLPDTPRSRLQQYRFTEKGRALLAGDLT